MPNRVQVTHTSPETLRHDRASSSAVASAGGSFGSGPAFADQAGQVRAALESGPNTCKRLGPARPRAAIGAVEVEGSLKANSSRWRRGG
jgi:hypothetical protein